MRYFWESPAVHRDEKAMSPGALVSGAVGQLFIGVLLPSPIAVTGILNPKPVIIQVLNIIVS